MDHGKSLAIYRKLNLDSLPCDLHQNKGQMYREYNHKRQMIEVPELSMLIILGKKKPF